MKYKVALNEKNVKKEDLSKRLIKMIDTLEEKAKTSTDKNSELGKSLDKLDDEIVKGIKKFNPEVHKRRLESMANCNKVLVSQRDGDVVEKPKEPKVEKPKAVVSNMEITEPEQPEVNVVEPEKEVLDESNIPEQPKKDGSDLERKLDELREKAYEAYNLRVHQQEIRDFVQEEIHPEELRDFQAAKTKKPRSRGKVLSFALMGVGAFFFGWGVVNFVRSK